MKRLYVLYDLECALCLRCRSWLNQQAAYIPLEFVPLQSESLEDRFPGIEAYQPKKELLVVSDEGAVYQGAYAWIMVLYALQEYRGWAVRFADPMLLPFAQRAIEALSSNRLTLSRWIVGGNAGLQREIAKTMPGECVDGSCHRPVGKGDGDVEQKANL